MNGVVIAGAEMADLGATLAGELGCTFSLPLSERFPDGERHVELREKVRGRSVALVYSLVAPVGEALVELALVADACRRDGAKELIGVLPYFAYARQDRRTAGEPLGGQVLATLVNACGFSRVIGVDLHSESAQGWFSGLFEHVSAAPLLIEAVRPVLLPGSVVVSPDLGGAKRAARISRALGLPLAVIHKTRTSAEAVEVHRVLGEVRGCNVLIVDDMISTAGTIVSAVAALRGQGCAADVSVAATHALLVGDAVKRLAGAGIRRLIHSDSVPLAKHELPFRRDVVRLAPLLAAALRGDKREL